MTRGQQRQNSEVKTVRQGANVDKVMAIWKWVCPKVVRTSFYLKSSHP